MRFESFFSFRGLGIGLFLGILGVSPAVSQAQSPSSGALSVARTMGITVPVYTCGATPVPGGSCCPGLTSLNGFVASAGMILDNNRDRLYVADFENNQIQVFDTQSLTLLTRLSTLGAGKNLNLPVDVALDDAGNLYVADLGNEAVEKFDSNFNYITSIAAGKGLSIVGVWAEGSSVYLSTMQNYIYRYTDGGSGYAASATFGGPAFLNHPNEIIKVGDWLYVADTYNNRIVKFDTTHPSPVPTPVQNCLLIPTGIRLDPTGNFLVEESDNGSYPAYVDRFSPDFTTLKNRCTFSDTWSAAEDPSGKTYISGMNSLSVTVLQSCGSPSASPAPTATPILSAATPTPTVTSSRAQAARALPNVSRNGQPIRFQVTLPQSGIIHLSLFSLTGELVYQADLPGQTGVNSLLWGLQNSSGAPVASGLYLYVIQVNGPSGESVQKGQVVVLH
ncbi:MAG: NHL repeat-containing protein [bacterium]